MFRSFRARLLLGSLLWTLGLLALAHVVSFGMIRAFPSLLRTGFGMTIFVGMVFMLFGILYMYRGVSPFRELRARLADVRAGTRNRLDGAYPEEVQPLVDDLNALLADREQAVKRARQAAADLAHGLKTPLAVLTREVEHLHATGNAEAAEGIEQQIQRMRRQVEYQLSRSRAASAEGSRTAQCSVGESIEGIIRVLRKLDRGRGLDFDIGVPPEQRARVQREDLDEMLGNLLENACKWARARVSVAVSQQNGIVTISVSDDGPGITREMREAVLQRGVRADEAAPGTGLGLAIVRDLAEAYGGSILLEDSPGGGLSALLRLPAVQH